MLFQKYAETEASNLEEAIRVIGLLMQGMALHAVEGDREEYQRFREGVLASLADFEADPSHQLMITAGAVLKQLEGYNRHATKTLKAQAMERQAMIVMLSETILKFGGVNQRAAVRLREIEAMLERTAEIDDVRILRARLAECLENIREGRVQLQADSQILADDAHSQMQARGVESPCPAPLVDIPDPVTGLPDMRAAIREIGALPAAGLQRYIGVFAANRLKAINARFGYAVGDLVLVAVKEQIAQRVSAEDRLFRWRGPCVVSLLDRPSPLPLVRQEVARVAGFRLDKTVEIGSRMILLPISCVWTVLQVDQSPQDLAAQVDAFVAAAEPPD